MTVWIICLEGPGTGLAEALSQRLPGYIGPDAIIAIRRVGLHGPIRELFAEAFSKADGIIAIMALGISFRMVAPLASSKLSDPAVVAMDDQGRWAISALSGHEGGANRLAYWVAAATGAEPVITTGSETARLFTMGLGCRKGIAAKAVVEAVAMALDRAGLEQTALRCAASIGLKRNEAGLIEAMREMDIPIMFIDEQRVREFAGAFSPSLAAQRQLNLPAVAEPCALLASRNGTIVLPRFPHCGVTVALAKEEARWQAV